MTAAVARYRGRFAPSPTGPLHLGSLFAAVGSFLEARARGGEWLVRIEDIDPPREVPGAAGDILRALEAYSLHWDGAVLFQSRRLGAYRELVDRLRQVGLAYDCACSRSDVEKTNALLGRPGSRVYPGTCRRGTARSDPPPLVRLRTAPETVEFTDRLQGRFAQSIETDVGDFVLLRRDGYAAYQLAVVADDHAQGVTDVVRGTDLLDSTPRQIYLQRLLGYPSPDYMHLPVIATPSGEKLSKQTGATALPNDRKGEIAWQVLDCLGQAPPPPLRGAAPAELWHWAIPRWRPERLAGRRSIPGSECFGCGAKM